MAGAILANIFIKMNVILGFFFYKNCIINLHFFFVVINQLVYHVLQLKPKNMLYHIEMILIIVFFKDNV